ncbi:MAG: 6-phosphogluconate dehydrogenase [Planctomycetota bacterium]|nr:6-phosphogluconate dehydrogenase [Planctomycetota bacterium]
MEKKGNEEWSLMVIIGPLIISAIMGLSIFLFGKFGGGFYEGYSEGERIGTLVKFSHKGIIWKTYEGELLTGVSIGSETAPQNSFRFSVTNKELIEQIKSNIGKKVKVKYTEFLIMPVQIGSSDYLITDVKIEN